MAVVAVEYESSEAQMGLTKAQAAAEVRNAKLSRDETVDLLSLIDTTPGDRVLTCAEPGEAVILLQRHAASSGSGIEKKDLIELKDYKEKVKYLQGRNLGFARFLPIGCLLSYILAALLVSGFVFWKWGDPEKPLLPGPPLTPLTIALANHLTITLMIAFIKLPWDVSDVLFKSYTLADWHFFAAIALGFILWGLKAAALWVVDKIICAGKRLKTKTEKKSKPVVIDLETGESSSSPLPFGISPVTEIETSALPVSMPPVTELETSALPVSMPPVTELETSALPVSMPSVTELETSRQSKLTRPKSRGKLEGVWRP